MFANGGVVVAAAPHMLFLKDTNGDDKADERDGAQHGLGHQRHATPARRTCIYGARQLHLGRRRLRRLQRRDERQADAVLAGRLPLQAGRLGVRVRDRLDQQHVGPRLLGDVRRLRLDGQQRSELLRRDSQSLLRGRRRAQHAARGRGERASATRARRSSTRAHFITPYIRQVDVHGGYTAAAGHQLYTARSVPEGVLEPHRLHHRADRAPGRPGDHGEGRRRLRHAATAGTCSPGAEEWVSPVHAAGRARTAPCGSPTGTTSSTSTTRRRRATATGRGNAYETSMRDGIAAASTASSYNGRDACRRRRSRRCRQRRRRGTRRGAVVRQHAVAAARAAPARRARPAGRRCPRSSR